MPTRRSALALAVPLLALLAAACGSNGSSSSSATSTSAAGATTSSSSGSTASTIKTDKAGTLTVATNLPAPGFWDGDASDPTNTAKLTAGFEHDTAAEVAKRLGLSGIAVVNVPFDAIVNGNKLDADLAFSQVTITDARKQAVDFSTAYFDADQGILVRKGTTVTGATLKTMKLGAQADTTGASEITDTIKPSKPGKTYPQVTDATSALQAKDIDAVILDTPIVLKIAAASGGALEVVAQIKTGEQYGAVLPKGSPSTAPVSAAITAMKGDGFFTSLYAKYFGGDPAKVPTISL
jgi:polar amino acid transport system substrate-binding protein